MRTQPKPRRLRIVLFSVILAAIATTAITFATQSHYVDGSGGTHSSSTHSSNPAHNWVSIGASNTQYTTSGGKYHDCYPTCGPAIAGDYALDISGNAGQTTAASLYLDYAGYGTGYTVTPNNNLPIVVDAVAGPVSNLRYPAEAACYYQYYDVRVKYWDTGGTYHVDTIGRLWYLHMNNSSWAYGNGAQISANATRNNPNGSSTISYLSGIRVANLYDGSGTCSSGQHAHIEWLDNHDWGAPYEWHGSGPDYYTPSGHIHYLGDNSNLYQMDYVSAGATLGFIGGGTTISAMWDNPNYSNH